MPAVAPTSSRAVFLSYAREDAGAARRIAEALRASGVVVWFDENELRGGDAWDAKIRHQISECTLFVPLISANTQERGKGYFRLEWKLAVEQTHLMAEGMAFLVPVAVDDTPEAGALVPPEFLRTQWTRLPEALPTPQFIRQIKQLAEGPRQDPPPAPAVTGFATPGKPAGPRSRAPLVAAVLGAAAAAVAIWYWAVRPSSPAGAATEPAKPVVPLVAAPPQIEHKSIAVLPFINMSEDSSNGYFADGLAEELLNLLAKVPGLQVTSRSSAFFYKGKELKLAQVARELNVAHILEGSVRKSGNRLRITAQLIDARTDTHLLSETYDRSLDDIFAVQDEIASAVVAQLKVTLLGAVPKSKSADSKAYALYLQGRQLEHQNSDEGVAQAVKLYQQALGIDATLAPAWIGLADCYLLQESSGLLPSEEAFRLARAAVGKALAINPDLAEAHALLGIIALNGDNDLAASARHFSHALALEPANIDILSLSLLLFRSLGRLQETIPIGEFIAAHDPVNAFGHARLGAIYIRNERYDDGIAELRTALRLSPERNQTHYAIGEALLRKGDPKAALEEMQRERSDAWRLEGLAMVYHALGQKALSDAALAEAMKKYEVGASWNIAYVLAFRGEVDRAFEWLEKAVRYRDSGLSDTAVSWEFASLHSDPRWLPFLRRIGRAPEQRDAIQFTVKLPAQ
jgi:TolB-like protein